MKTNQDEIFYRIALSFVPGIGSKLSAALMEQLGTARAVLEAPLKAILKFEGMGEQRARALKDPEIYSLAEREMSFVQSKNIQVLVPGMDAFPQRLLECADAPGLLYHRGNTDFNVPKTIAVIGTRKNTEYGQRLCNDLIDQLSKIPDLLVVSGLAHGIDTLAHKAALRNGLKTVGVLAHGLNMIYPTANKNLSKELMEQGGLLTEFSSLSKTDKGNFPARNRIVAGLSDVTVVVESDVKGGALITAYIAQSYNREVAAFPGRAYDSKSGGTNALIRKNVAALICDADDLLQLMSWDKVKRKQALQTQLMLNLTEEEQKIVDILSSKDLTHADELLLRCGTGSSILASNLLMLEMQGLIKSLPGKFYRMN